MPNDDKIFIRETWERPTAEHPNGSHLQQIGDQFLTATGRFEILRLKARSLMHHGDLRFLHRGLFGYPPVVLYNSFGSLPWWIKPLSPCTTLVKQGCVALVHVPGKGR